MQCADSESWFNIFFFPSSGGYPNSVQQKRDSLSGPVLIVSIP